MKKTTFLGPLAVVVLLSLVTSPATAAEGIQLMEHCRYNSKVVHSFNGLGCHQVTNSGASYSAVDGGVQPLFYATSDCSGPTSRSGEASRVVNFCDHKFENGNSLNDKVRSVRLVAACPVLKSFSVNDYCFEGGKDNPNCCVCPPDTKWSNVSAHYRQCIPK